MFMSHSLYLVVGLGKTGLSIARYLQRKNKSFVVFDTREDAPGLAECNNEFPHIPVYLEHLPAEVFEKITDVIASPGVPLDHPLIQQAVQRGVAVYGDIECLARDCNAPIIAITGTNGKSTVVTLLGEMAKAAGFRVAVAGNIGTPVLDLLDDGHHYDLWVLELSSFQLDLTHSLAPRAASILNVSPDHLDRHHDFASYVHAKQRIYHQAQMALFHRQDPYTVPTGDLPSSSFGTDAPEPGHWGLRKRDDGFYLAFGQECILSVDSLLIKGVHNWLNALAACALAELVSIPMAYRLSVLKSFSGLPHRCQWVRTQDGVEWINDSKGTNIGAAISAINGIGEAMQGKIVLIAGGQGKGADFNELKPAVTNFVRSVVLLGEDADKIEAVLHELVPVVKVSSLEEAVHVAKTHAKSGDVVLLSPACASLDMFRDFNHRGEVFISSVQDL
jgi:UDP-N-acetylmuramoylalanine--D-glutamate ligase